MFSKRIKPRSIASQLVLRFTIAAALLLLCGLFVLYLIVVRHAFEEDNAFFADKLAAFRADLKTLSRKEALQEQLNLPRSGKDMTYWVRVSELDGKVIAETPGMSELLPSAIFPKSPAVDNPPQDYRFGNRLFSLVTAAAQSNGHALVIQLGQDRTADVQFTHQFAALLLVVLLVGIGLSALIAATVTRRGLRPLAEMTQSLQRIGPTQLHERVPPREWPRELQPLARAFDDMLERLENSFTRLSQFSADIAHEIRTPIANIRGEAEVALNRERTPAEYREVMESNVAECERLSGIVDKLLFLARAEAAEGHVQRTSFDGRAEIEKIAAFYEPVAEEQKISIDCTGSGKISADPLLFTRAISNLVENALRFTPARGEIVLSISANGKESRISVADNGCGIAQEHLPRVFDRFYRIDPSRSVAGAGLGLSLVKSITDLHGGSARIESEPGRGTTVTLTFPSAN
jgi:two-component system heavy metal sensor histidine kinase CusS